MLFRIVQEPGLPLQQNQLDHPGVVLRADQYEVRSVVGGHLVVSLVQLSSTVCARLKQRGCWEGDGSSARGRCTLMLAFWAPTPIACTALATDWLLPDNLLDTVTR
jgi:hypothetical protein